MNLRRFNIRLLVLPVVFALAMPLVSAATRHTVQGDLTAFLTGFQALFRGNTSAFVKGIIAATPLIGLFFVVFGLVFFLGRYTIFRGSDDKKLDRYARWFATGVALVGIVQQGVYNTVLGWTTTFLVLGFIMITVFMFILTLNKLRGSHLGELTALHKATAEEKTAQKDLLKIKHEVRQDQKMYEKTERDLMALDENLTNIERLSGDELAQIDHLAEMLRQVTSGANESEGTIHAYAKQLSRDVGSLIVTIEHERKQEDSIHKYLREIDKYTDQIKEHEKHEADGEKHFDHVLTKILKDDHAHKVQDDDLKTAKKENKTIKDDFRILRENTGKLKLLEEEIRKQVETVDKYGFRTKYDAAVAVQNAIMTHDFVTANKYLYQLRQIIEHERHVVQNLSRYDHEMTSIIDHIDKYEKEISVKLKSIVKKLKEDSTKKKDEEKATKSVSKLFKNMLTVISDKSQSVVSVIHGFLGSTESLIKLHKSKKGGDAAKLKDLEANYQFASSTIEFFHGLHNQIKQYAEDVPEGKEALQDHGFKVYNYLKNNQGTMGNYAKQFSGGKKYLEQDVSPISENILELQNLIADMIRKLEKGFGPSGSKDDDQLKVLGK